MVSFEGASTRGRDRPEPTYAELLAENQELGRRLATAELELRELRIELSQRS